MSRNSDLYRHVKSDRAKWVFMGLAIVLICAVLITGILTNWFNDFNRFCLFGHTYVNGFCVKCGEQEPEKTDELVSTVVAEHGIKLRAAAPVTTYSAETGTTTMSQQITATVVPETAIVGGLNWTLSWETENAGKLVTDYVRVADSAAQSTNTITCYQPFDKPIILTVGSARNSAVKAMCKLNYIKERLGLTGFDIGVLFENGQDYIYTSDEFYFKMTSKGLYGNDDAVGISPYLLYDYGVGTKEPIWPDVANGELTIRVDPDGLFYQNVDYYGVDLDQLTGWTGWNAVEIPCINNHYTITRDLMQQILGCPILDTIDSGKATAADYSYFQALSHCTNASFGNSFIITYTDEFGYSASIKCPLVFDQSLIPQMQSVGLSGSELDFDPNR